MGNMILSFFSKRIIKLALVGIIIIALGGVIWWNRHDAVSDFKQKQKTEVLEKEKETTNAIRRAVPRPSTDSNASIEWLREFSNR